MHLKGEFDGNTISGCLCQHQRFDGRSGRAIGGVLRQMDVTVEVHNAKDVTDLRAYDAVVLGSSIRGGRWLPEAIRFIERFREQLATRPVAYFTTCLTLAKDNEESRRIVLSYLDPVLRLAPEIQPVGLGMFAGSLDQQHTVVMQNDVYPQGDYRNWDRIRKWAAEISPLLVARPPKERTPQVVAGWTRRRLIYRHWKVKR